MTEFFYLHTAHGRQLAADRTSGQVCSVEHAADHAQYPRLLAIVPSFRPDVLFLSAGDEAPFPISVQPHAFKSHLLPLFVERGQSDGTVALQFPGSVRYLCAGPGQPGTPASVVANAEKRQTWENFSTVPVSATAIAIPHHVTAQALDGLFDGTQISDALPRFLARAPSPAARHVLQGAALLLDLEDLDRVAGALMQDPSRVAEFARHLPDDYWATVALPELQKWLAHRGRVPAGCDHVDLAAGQPAGMVDHQPHKLLLPEVPRFPGKGRRLWLLRLPRACVQRRRPPPRQAVSHGVPDCYRPQ